MADVVKSVGSEGVASVGRGPQVAALSGPPLSYPLSAYSAGGVVPKTVSDFAAVESNDELFGRRGRISLFEKLFTYTGASNKTMVDSDGLLKWAPHNGLSRSSDFTSWTQNELSVVDDSVDTLVEGVRGQKLVESSTSSRRSVSIANAVGSANNVTIACVAKSAGEDRYLQLAGYGLQGGNEAPVFNLDTGNVTTSGTNNILQEARISHLGEGWYLCEADVVPDGTSNFFVFLTNDPNDHGSHVYLGDGSSGLFVWLAYSHRRDIGGVVEVPSDGVVFPGLENYVPTTTAARYLARRNHHRYNGTSFVNKGIRLESEQRTNLDPNSDDLSAWTTSSTTIAKDQTGADGVANSAHSITATGANGTALEQITAASNPHVWSCLMKRITGTGTVEVTVDGGTTWVAVTSEINSSEFVTVSTGPGATVTDPEFGVRLGTSGDAVAVQVSQLEQTSGQASSPIPTNGSAVTRAAETLKIPAANMSYSGVGMSFQVEGELDYADEGSAAQVTFMRWQADANNFISIDMDTDGAATGEINANQAAAGVTDTVVAGAEYSPGLNVPFNVASRNTDTDINVAKDGVAGTADATPTALADVSSADFELAPDFMGTLALARQWDRNVADAGTVEATT